MRKLRPDEIDALRNESGGTHPVAVLVEDVRSIYNVGAIFRTADAAGVSEIILTGITGTPENRSMHKTALGAQDSVPWRYFSDASAAIARLKEQGYRLAALEITDSPTPSGELTVDDFPLCLIVGNEVNGISADTIERADLALELPQYGSKQSLNAAVAFGITVYDVVRRYRALHAASLRTRAIAQNESGKS